MKDGCVTKRERNLNYPRRISIVGTLLIVATIISYTSDMTADESGYERLVDGAATHISSSGEGLISSIQRRGLLEVGVGLFEPWIMCGKGGDLIGYEIDVAKALAEDLRVRIRFVRTDWYFIIPELIDGKFDLIISGMAITPARTLLVNFTIPYAEFGTLVLINTQLLDEPYSQAGLNASEFNLGAREGTIPAQLASDRFPQATLRLFDADAPLLASLVAGELHAVVVDQVKASRWLNANSEILHSPFDPLHKVPEAIALRKGYFDALNVLDSWIEHRKSSGWLDSRRQYWFETRDWEDSLASDPDELNHCIESFN